MDVFETFAKRKSVRSYLEAPVPDEVLSKVMDTARLAPSAGNIQPWHFVIIREKEKRAKIAKGCKYGKFLSETPVVIIACGDKKASPRWHSVETSIALEHIVIAATALGLGTCWIGMFNEEEIRKMIDLPKRFEIIALMALGYPSGKVDLGAKLLHAIRPRKKLEDIISKETYSNSWKCPTNIRDG